MFDDTDDRSADRALRAGLYDIPTPEVSADFDSRIQAALTQNPSWQQTLWMALRPALPTMGWTMAAMLLLLRIAQQPVSEAPTTEAFAGGHATAQQPLYAKRSETRSNRSNQDSGEDAENMDLSYASLSFFSRPRHQTPEKSG